MHHSGLVSGLLTRATRQVEIVEPLAVLGTAYTAYYLAEVFHWSGIISLIGCGITQVLVWVPRKGMVS